MTKPVLFGFLQEITTLQNNWLEDRYHQGVRQSHICMSFEHGLLLKSQVLSDVDKVTHVTAGPGLTCTLTWEERGQGEGEGEPESD